MFRKICSKIDVPEKLVLKDFGTGNPEIPFWKTKWSF